MYKTILLGRTGSGRAFLQKLLEKKGFRVAKSYTTRDRKDKNDTMHYFLNEDPCFSVKDTDMLLKTKHNGNTYFYTREELEQSDIIPVDPENVGNLCAMYPDTIFRFAIVMASNEDRLKNAVRNADDKLTAEEDFIAACEEENKAFCEFEDAMLAEERNSLGIKNITQGHAVNNDFTASADICHLPDALLRNKRLFERTQSAIKTLIECGSISADENGGVKVFIKDKGMQTVTLDVFTESVLTDDEGMAAVMREYLRLENIKL